MKNKRSEEEIQKEIAALKAMPDSEIDYSDIPATTDFTGWYRRYDKKMYKPRKKAVCVRIDMDVLEWLKQQDNYSALINNMCRQTMDEAQRKSA